MIFLDDFFLFKSLVVNILRIIKRHKIMNSIKQKFFSRAEAAQFWRCSKRTIDRRIRDGFIKAKKLSPAKGARVLIYIDSMSDEYYN